MKKIYLALIAVVSFIAVVFVNSYIPPSYEIIEKQKVEIDFEKRLETLYENLKPCKAEDNSRLIAECEFPIKNEIKILEFKQKSKIFDVGPISYYYAGGEVAISEQGMAVFNLDMLAENTGSSDIVILHCSGAVSCNYHVWDGKTKYIFSSNNFAAGNIGINPGQTKSLNIVFGPGQGYGNYVDFEYDPLREYSLLIDESFGSAEIPLELREVMNQDMMNEMMKRGDIAMGFTQTKIMHHFADTATGGEIRIIALDDNDTKTISEIRSHVKDIQQEFSQGNFSKPFFIHAQVVPGTQIMTEKKDLIQYSTRQIEGGEVLVLTTNDSELLDAIKQFMDYQSSQHMGH